MSSHKQMEVRTFLSYSEIFEDKLPLRVIKGYLRQLKSPQVLVVLAKINAMVALTKINGKDFPSREVSAFLIENFIPPGLRRHPRVRKAQEEGHPLFVRHPLLALLRLCASECSDTAPKISDGRSLGGYLLGQCCIAMPDHLITREAERAMAQGTENSRRHHHGIHMAPTFEFNFTPDFHYAMARWETMLTEILDSDAYKAKIGKFDLAAKFYELAGIKLELYRDLIFTILAYYYSLNFENIKDEDFLLFHRTGIISQTQLEQRDFDRFLDLCSIKLEDLPVEMGKFTEAHPNILPQLDFAVMRQRPILELGRGGMLCLDPFFLIDKLGYGLHHTIRDSLPLKADKQLASKAYGLLFELYVDSIMQQIYPRGEEFFISFPQFRRRKKQSHEAFDGILVCRGGHLIVFEYKGGFLASDPKYSGRVRPFVEELDKKFGIGESGAGVSQLIRKIQRLFHCEKSERDLIPELQGSSVQVVKITPVLIVQEPYLRWDFNWLLNQRFQRLLKKAKVSNAIKVMPLQVIDIESLEKMRPNLIAEDFRLEHCLNARAYDDPEMISIFFMYIEKLFQSYGTREDPEIDRRFETIRGRNLRGLFGRDNNSGIDAAPAS